LYIFKDTKKGRRRYMVNNMSSDSSSIEPSLDAALDDSSPLRANHHLDASSPLPFSDSDENATTTPSNNDEPNTTTIPSPPSLSSSSFGRIKEPPNCTDQSMRALATPTEKLRQLAFPPPRPLNGTSTISTIITSAASTTATLSEPHPAMIVRQQSRQGRQHQRSKPGGVRQVTGCVPILRNAQILLVSASRKNTWILPKGGWESDETMAVAAVRETFEEAGVTGTLRPGPPLPPVTCHSRKVDSPVSEVSFYCLYVQHVADDWPEQGRLRRAVSIETALELVRPEFRPLLTLVQAQLLHHWPDDIDIADAACTGEEGIP
jgi:diphosphoinositol-polyphosphate diphosphatase